MQTLLPPLKFVLLVAETSMKAAWKWTVVVSGRLSVTTPGTSQKQMWSVAGWGMDMPYWRYRRLPLERDRADSGKEAGTAMEMRPAWIIAAAVVPLAPTLKMHLWSALAVVRLSVLVLSGTSHHITCQQCMHVIVTVVTHLALLHSAEQWCPEVGEYRGHSVWRSAGGLLQRWMGDSLWW